MLSGGNAFGKGGREREGAFLDSGPDAAHDSSCAILEDWMSLRRILAVTGLLVATSPAGAADLPGRVAVKEPIEVKAPCADLDVLERIAERFAWAEANNWHRGFVMA